jgi:hypothetical protein
MGDSRTSMEGEDRFRGVGFLDRTKRISEFKGHKDVIAVVTEAALAERIACQSGRSKVEIVAWG